MKAILSTFVLASTLLTGVARADDLPHADYERLMQVFEPAQNVVDMADSTDADRAYLPPEAKILENAAACSAAAKDALDHKLDPTAELVFHTVVDGQAKTTVVTLGNIDAKVCQPAAAKGKGLDERRAKAKAAAIEAKLGPFKKLGVAGDKLALVDKFWTEVLGPNEANPTPQVVAKSNVLFRLIKDDDVDYTLMRYEFRGNKQVKVTTQTFHYDPPASKYH